MARPAPDPPSKSSRFTSQCCGDCDYFHKPHADAPRGQCRIAPPQVIVVLEKQTRMEVAQATIVNKVQAYYPPVDPGDAGCARYEPAT